MDSPKELDQSLLQIFTMASPGFPVNNKSLQQNITALQAHMFWHAVSKSIGCFHQIETEPGLTHLKHRDSEPGLTFKA